MVASFVCEVSMSIEAEVSAPDKILTPRRSHVAHAWLERSLYDKLQHQAQLRRMHPDALAAAILDVVLGEDGVDLLLGV